MSEYDVMLTGRVTKTQANILDRLAESYGLTRSQALRRVIQDAERKTRVVVEPHRAERQLEAAVR